MNTLPTDRDEEIFMVAADLPVSERPAYLVEACGGDLVLLARVKRLLASHEQSGFMARPVAAISGAISLPPFGADEALPEQPGEQIGNYKLIEQIGEGGFGTVWLAEQEQPVRRQVAVKLLKVGMGIAEVVARFEQERQALAVMDHPNIAKVFDAGATSSGRPYFVMELVRGVSITKYCDESKLPTVERLRLFIAVCQAVQHAHQKGIIHRDLKPTNILVTLQDGVAVPKVIDFGVAKVTQGRLTEKTLSTRFEQMIGTPVYMSPEQAEMSGHDVDTRSDIYSLGVMLYELLTGRTPFNRDDMQKAGYKEMRRLICETEPKKPSTALETMAEHVRTTIAADRHTSGRALTTLIRGDLDWIVLKAIEKDPNRRYESASGLAADIRRHLDREPVTARPPSFGYRSRTFVRKHRVPVMAAAAVALALISGLVVATVLYLREKEAWKSESIQRASAQLEAAKNAQTAQFMREILSGIEPDKAKGRDVSVLKEILQNAEYRIGTELTRQPMLEAELRATIGQVYKALGMYREADSQYTRAYKLAREFAGPEADLTLVYRTNLATAVHGAGRHAEADAELRAILDIRARRFAVGDIHTLEARTSLAVALGNEARFAECDAVIREVLRVLAEVVPADDEHVLTAREVLARSLYNQDKLREAIDEFRQVLDVRVKSKGPDHSTTLLSRFNLARALEDQEEDRMAEEEYRRVLEARQRILGHDHPATLSARNRLAACMSKAGKYKDAEAEHRTMLDLCEKKLGISHPETIQCYVDLSNCLLAQLKAGDALPLLLHAEENCVRVHGAGHPATRLVMATRTRIQRVIKEMESLERDRGGMSPASAAASATEMLAIVKRTMSEHEKGPITPDLIKALQGVSDRMEAELRNHPLAEMRLRGSLGKAYLKLGKYAAAEAHFTPALEIAERFLDRDSETTLMARAYLGAAQSYLGKYPEAETNLREVVAGRKRLLGAEHSETLAARVSLAQVLLGEGKYEEMEAESGQLISAYERMFGCNHPKTLACRANLCVALLEQGKFSEAENGLRKVIDAGTKAFGPEHPRVLLARNNLASILLQEPEKLPEAERELRESLPIRMRIHGAEHSETLTTRNNLANALVKLGRFAEAESELRDLVPLEGRVLGAKHRLTLNCRLNLAMARDGLGDSEEAEAELYDVVAKQSEYVGPDHPDTLESLSYLVRLLRKLGKDDDARFYARNLVETRKRISGMHHPQSKAAEELYKELLQSGSR